MEQEPNDATPFLPEQRTLSALRKAAGGCRGCHLWRPATQPCNVVKHFSFEERGSRRIHQTPKRFEVEACKPWLAEELRAVESEALVFLGATAAEDLRVVAQALGWREP